ncbi:hypothetical protein [Nonomuraea diastatica]|uniref:Uncharacterized protein n=1 Tax=Nonomuraea diastatica TaxID=1848329 RepID=A0A4V2YG23_9ACTN|nr:hypothetical protein [Nonomuraea diastatica]TDD25357.1 hypothetical protein E1294_03550 [Nonomuraea diastatica]
MLLPVEAAAVWQRHLAEQEADRQQRAQEKELGERLPATKRVPACPGCKSSYLQVAYTGPVVHALVNTADPDSGIQDVVVDTDVAQLDEVAWVKCDRAAARPGPRQGPAGQHVGVPHRDHRRRTRAAARRTDRPRQAPRP